MTRRLLVSYLTITAFVLLILEIPLAATTARKVRPVRAYVVRGDRPRVWTSLRWRRH